MKGVQPKTKLRWEMLQRELWRRVDRPRLETGERAPFAPPADTYAGLGRTTPLPLPSVFPDKMSMAKALVRPGANADASDVHEVARELAGFPLSVLQRLARRGVQVIAVREHVAHHIGTSGRPRGWPPGSTWEMVHGVYDVVARQVVVATKDVDGARVLVDRTSLAHEVGHALDVWRPLHWRGAFRGAHRATRAFREAYEKDRPRLESEDRRYFLQPGAAGRSEAFAEGFALAVVGSAAEQARMPHLVEFWRDVLRRAQETT